MKKVLPLMIIFLLIGALLYFSFKDKMKKEYQVSVTKNECLTKKEGNKDVKVMYIYVDYTNKSNHDEAFGKALTDAAYQNNIGLAEYTGQDLMPEDTDKLTKIKPGATITVTLAYKLRDNSSVDFELTDHHQRTQVFTVE